MKAKINSSYSEYDAWLQKGSYEMTKAMRLISRPGVPKIAAEECTQGMIRLFGPGIWQENANFTMMLEIDDSLPKEGYRLSGHESGFTIQGGDGNGVLYGVFRMLLHLGAGNTIDNLSVESAPQICWRILNHWDNLDGTVERGYAGKSIFFRNNDINYDPKRIRDYARLLASVGINGICINNVNVTNESARLITREMLPKVAELADLFRPYGIRLILAVHFESPVLLGGLPSADPLDERVANWWKEQVNEIYSFIPDFAGFLVKADSEFRGGPAQLGRTQADGANVLARALAPHGGLVFWRCFIYNCRQDWRDKVTDRPKAPYELFYPLDGSFDSNVVLQVKYGPVDFQVREPLSPLLGAMKKTREALELQITQEYTGQQIDLYALPVQWEEIFSMPTDREHRLVDLMGKGKEIDAVCGVANIGDDFNWTGHTLAQANLFGFGRMTWNPRLSAEQIIREWTALTFGNNTDVIDGITRMMLASRGIYEKYTAPLGIGWMVNVGNHYGPSVDGYEYKNWGTYHRADHKAIGVDRTSRGTGYTLQYDPWLTAIYDDPSTCPEELLLFFHRLPYQYVLKSGKTLIQHIYDTHFEGVEGVEELIRIWDSLKDFLPEEAYLSVKKRLNLQLVNAREWRDVVNTYFYRKSFIPDAKGRKIYT